MTIIIKMPVVIPNVTPFKSFFLCYKSVVKRGCKPRYIKVNGKEHDGEGCEEILRPAARYSQLLCLCQKSLCNGSVYLLFNTISYRAIIPFMFFHIIFTGNFLYYSTA